MTHAAITGWGKCMPPAVLDNVALASFLDTSDEWIMTRTGIHERRVSHVPITTLSQVASLFGDGAAAVLIQASEEPLGPPTSTCRRAIRAASSSCRTSFAARAAAATSCRTLRGRPKMA